MYFMPQFTAATGKLLLESVISPMRFCIHAGSGKVYAYKKAKDCANKVKQCCEVCRARLTIVPVVPWQRAPPWGPRGQFMYFLHEKSQQNYRNVTVNE